MNDNNNILEDQEIDKSFANDKNQNLIQSLYLPHTFQVSVNLNQFQCTQEYTICIERLNNIIQLRLCDILSHQKMFVCTIDDSAYHRIKNEQLLQVNFEGFVSHLINILHSCRKNELFLSLVKRTDHNEIQFYEKRPLKNLVHLFLPIKEASSSIIIYHMNLMLTRLQTELKFTKEEKGFIENELHNREYKIKEYQSKISVLDEKITEKENMILHRNTEEIKRLTQEIKSLEVTKEFEENRLRAQVKSFESKVDQMAKENSSKSEQLMIETKKYESISQELCDIKFRYNTLISECNLLKNNLGMRDTKEKLQNKRIDELNQQVQEYEKKLKQADKERSNLNAELEAEKNLCLTKKRALQIATDEISKNHETIAKHEKILEKNKKSIDWRTIILLRIGLQQK